MNALPGGRQSAQLRIIASTWGLARPLPGQQEEGAVTLEKLERISVRASAAKTGSSQHTADQGGVRPALGPELGGSSGIPEKAGAPAP